RCGEKKSYGSEFGSLSVRRPLTRASTNVGDGSMIEAYTGAFGVVRQVPVFTRPAHGLCAIRQARSPMAKVFESPSVTSTILTMLLRKNMPSLGSIVIGPPVPNEAT